MALAYALDQSAKKEEAPKKEQEADESRFFINIIVITAFHPQTILIFPFLVSFLSVLEFSRCWTKKVYLLGA